MSRYEKDHSQYIKAKLVDFILLNYGNDAIIASEVPVDSKQNIIDMIVIIGSNIYGFEIKSAFDTNMRLEQQLETFSGAFNRLYVVCAETFYKKNMQKKSSVGIIVYNENGLSIAKEAKIRKMPLKKKLANFLWKSDIPNVDSKIYVSVEELKARLCKKKTAVQVLDIAIKALKKRYQPRHDAFMQARGSRTCIQDVDILTIQDRYMN